MTLGEGFCIEVNNAFVEASGYTREEALGRRFRDLGVMEEPDIDGIIEKLQHQGKLVNEECNAFRKTGEKMLGLVSADLIEINGAACVVATMLDITERKQMEEKFLRVQRMESIGALAGGMAHDLNNILAPILMSASMLRDQKLAEPVRQLVCGIEEAAQRGANIVNQVLTFARGVKGKHTVINARDLAGEIAKMVKEIFPKSIAFSFNVPEVLWNISGDTTQLQQVFLNLCVNARDAMPGGGALALSVDNIEVDEAFAHMVASASPGRYVQFSVSDSGTGIPKKIVDRIFEPFFTTKEPGKGTGLGLSTVVGIVRSHAGFLKVESEVGKGSIFRVFIPATTNAVRKKEIPDQPTITRGNGETLLVVDDEPEILEIICSILQQNNWQTISATDGVEGVASYLMHSGKIKALITDMVMPNMDGLGLIRSVRKLAPDLPILVASGFSNEESRGELDELHISGFLKKPFSARQLVARVATLLYGPKGNPPGRRK
jgi:two-component system, cell cycle sensor histidine kinase and response regulator CckA